LKPFYAVRSYTQKLINRLNLNCKQGIKASPNGGAFCLLAYPIGHVRMNRNYAATEGHVKPLFLPETSPVDQGRYGVAEAGQTQAMSPEQLAQLLVMMRAEQARQ
jgi:hypothetical protein